MHRWSACRDVNGKAKAQLDLDLVYGNKGYYKYAGNKTKTRENVRLRLSGAKDLSRMQIRYSMPFYLSFYW